MVSTCTSLEAFVIYHNGTLSWLPGAFAVSQWPMAAKFLGPGPGF